jgi:hypothetical protein
VIYLHATIQVTLFKTVEFRRVLAAAVIPIFEKHGAKLIGSWETMVGNQSEITDIWAFETMAHFEKSTQSLMRDSEWAKVKDTLATMTVKEKTKLLVPLKCSPLK